MGLLDFDSKRLSFDSLSDWSSYTIDAIRTLTMGVLGVLLAIIIGLYSVACRACAFLEKIIRMRPVLSVAVVFILMNIICIAAIMNVKVQAKTYEHERDSLSYELSKYTQAYVKDTCTIITNDSTYIYIY